MTQEYATPLAFRTALEHRLRDRAAKQGTDLSRLRQLLVFERFLERAFRVLGRDAVLKGGAALELRNGEINGRSATMGVKSGAIAA